MNSLPQISLYYAEGRSDKEYHAGIVEVSGSYAVNFRYGRRGFALTSGTKTSVPVDLDQAKAIFHKLVKEKAAKGYTSDVSGTAYQGTEHAGQTTGFVPQLLNPVTESQALAAIADIHAIYLSRQHQPLALRLLVDFLAERFAGDPAPWDLALK